MPAVFVCTADDPWVAATVLAWRGPNGRGGMPSVHLDAAVDPSYSPTSDGEPIMRCPWCGCTFARPVLDGMRDMIGQSSIR